MLRTARGETIRGSRYETLVPIGTGGMATVFVGQTVTSDGARLVALKRAHPHVRADAALAASMKREAWLASRLDHPNIVRVLDIEEGEDDLVLVLDYVEGCTLRTLLSRTDKLGDHRPRETLRILLDIAAGLHAAHHATDEDGRHLGLVHRDVSPSNILVGVDGIARLSDFGIAKAYLEGADRTETGVLKGKSSYMAPEYVMHQHAHPASDLFSLAVTGWESLAGARLFRGATEIETLERVIRADTRPLGREHPELAPLDAAFRRALARLPKDRQPSVDAFARDLEARARSAGLLASHAEVRLLVERVIGGELAERRSALPGDVATLLYVREPSATRLFERDAQGEDVPAEESATTTWTAEASATDVLAPALAGAEAERDESATAIFDERDAADPTEPLVFRRARGGSSAPPAALSAPTVPGRPKRRRPRTRPRSERRALFLASLVLAIALAAMAVQLWRSPPH